MQFSDPIASGLYLVRQALRSPNYVPGVSGWTINEDGSSELSDVTIRGDFRTGPPAPYVQILNGSASVDLIPGNPAVTTPGRLLADADVIRLQSPAISGNTIADMVLASGDQLSADPIDHPAISLFNKTNLFVGGQIAASSWPVGVTFDGTTRSTAATAYTGIAGDSTPFTIDMPISGRILLLFWALTNNATAGANTNMSAEIRNGSLAGAILTASTDAGCVRNNSTGNVSGFGFMYADLSAFVGTVNQLYVRNVYRVSAGTGNFVQHYLMGFGLP